MAVDGDTSTSLPMSESSIRLTPVMVVMKIDPSYHKGLHTDSRVSLGTVGVLGDTVLDIGRNDGTLLKSYSVSGVRKIGIDPTGAKFRQYYSDDVTLVPEFFSVEAYRRVTPSAAKVVTSIAMFYDLEDPISFG